MLYRCAGVFLFSVSAGLSQHRTGTTPRRAPAAALGPRSVSTKIEFKYLTSITVKSLLPLLTADRIHNPTRGRTARFATDRQERAGDGERNRYPAAPDEGSRRGVGEEKNWRPAHPNFLFTAYPIAILPPLPPNVARLSKCLASLALNRSKISAPYPSACPQPLNAKDLGALSKCLALNPTLDRLNTCRPMAAVAKARHQTPSKTAFVIKSTRLAPILRTACERAPFTR